MKYYFRIENMLWTFNEYMALQKARGSFKEMKNQPQIQSLLKERPEMEEFLSQIWDDIVPLTVQKIFQRDIPQGEPFWNKANNRLRIMFQHVGVANIMNGIKNKKLRNTYIDKRVQPHKQSDVYELYSFNSEELGLTPKMELHAVKMWCPSTMDEHWLYVDHRLDFCQKNASAKEAIAWCCMVPSNAKINKIYRQGEVFTFEYESYSNLSTEFRHLTGDEYFEKLVFQS